jgi:acyl carrier protein
MDLNESHGKGRRPSTSERAGADAAMDDLHQKIRDHIVGSYLFGDGSKLREDTSFLRDSIVDSTGMLELIGYLEQEFGVKVEDTELIPENLDSVNNIADFIRRKRG